MSRFFNSGNVGSTQIAYGVATAVGATTYTTVTHNLGNAPIVVFIEGQAGHIHEHWISNISATSFRVNHDDPVVNTAFGWIAIVTI